jgi:hypothetical protein
MGYAPETMVTCADLQANLDQYFPTCKKRPIEEFYNFLWSDANRSGIQQLISPTSGKRRTVVLKYDQPILEDQVTATDTSVTSCVATTKRGNLSKEYTIETDGFKVEELIDPADLIDVCEGNGEIVARKMQNMIDALIGKLASDMADQAAALIGNWPTFVSPVINTNYLDIDTINAAGNPNPIALEEIDFAITQSDFCNGAMIFADRNLWKLYRLLAAGCCSTSGLDLNSMLAQYGKAVAYDRKVASNGVAGANRSWVVMPGALQPIYFTMNGNGVADAAGVTRASYTKGIIFDPETGTPIDLTVKDDCGEVSIIMKATQKLIALPDDMYPPSHEKEGFVGFAGIEVTNP